MLALISVPAFVLTMVADDNPKPRSIITIGLLKALWFVSWTLVTVIGAIGTVILVIVISNNIQEPNLRGIVSVIVLVLIWGARNCVNCNRELPTSTRVFSLYPHAPM